MRPTVGFSAPLFMKKHHGSPEEQVNGNQCECQDCSCGSKKESVVGKGDAHDPHVSPQCSKSGVETQSPKHEFAEKISTDADGETIEETGDTEDSGDGVKTLELDAEALQEEIARLQEREEELNQRLTRLQADFDNFRRRSRKELQEQITRANEELIGELLPVLDNLDRALEVKDNASSGSLRDGLELVYRQFLDILAKEGLQPIKALGETFDPNIHAAVMVEEVDEPNMDNRVIQELQKGYSFRERVLRAAVVKVAKASH